MNYSDIITALKESNGNVSDSAYGYFPEEIVGKTEQVYDQGGEGKGEDWERVYHFIDHNVFISFTGFYSSYNGTDFDGGWDCASEVFPKEKTITIYE